MKSLLNLALALLLVSVALTPALAGQNQPADQANQLRTAARDLAAKSGNTKGAPRQLMLMESHRLDELADKIQAGDPVDPSEIDKAIDRAEHGQF